MSQKRNDILDASEELFVEKGFNETSLNSLIKIMKIAKGTFYHYFSSKDELLDSLLLRIVEDIIGELRPMLESKELNAIEKLNLFYRKSGESKMNGKQLGRIRVFLKLFKNSLNSKLMLKMQETSVKYVAPEVEAIIKQGVEEKLFKTDYSEALSKLILNIGFSLQRDFIELFMSDHAYEEGFEKVKTMLSLYEVSIERILGAEEGSLHLFEEKTIAKMLKEINKEKL